MVEDLKLIDNINILKDKEIIICGSKEYITKVCKLILHANMHIKSIYTDDMIVDDELRGICVFKFSDIYDLPCLSEYNVIYAERDQELMEQKLKIIDFNKENHIYTYCGVYIAMSLEEDLLCMNELNHAVGMYDFAARWLRGIRWVEESGINLLLYAMPKTGTQSMQASLRQLGIEHTYIHFLNILHPLNKQFYTYFDNRIPCLQQMVNNKEYVGQNYLNRINNKKIKILTSVREPIARNYSMLFQAIKNWGVYPLTKESNGNFREGVLKYLEYCSDSTFEWFDYEIKEIFGIDIYQYPFDKEKGYSIIRCNNIEIFIYKIEKSNELTEALREFLEIDEFEFLLKHESMREEYRFIYQQLKRELRIPESILSKSYLQSRINHFYTAEEIQSFINKWR